MTIESERGAVLLRWKSLFSSGHSTGGAPLSDMLESYLIAALIGKSDHAEVLDIGAGTGRTARFILQSLRARGWEGKLICTDALPFFIAPGAEFLLSDMFSPPFRNGTFDVIIARHVLEGYGIEAVHSFLYECCRILRPGGLLMVEDILHHPLEVKNPSCMPNSMKAACVLQMSIIAMQLRKAVYRNVECGRVRYSAVFKCTSRSQ
ncbi:MAG: class I SAM-dependent methyltransferase [Methanomassiliicoccales archaeon]